MPDSPFGDSRSGLVDGSATRRRAPTGRGRGDRLSPDDLAETEPAVISTEGGGELVAPDHAHAAGPVEARPDDPRRGAALGHLDLDQAPLEVAAQPGADLRLAELQGPAVQWAVVVV